MSVQTSTALPSLHVCAVTELLCKVVDTILPFIERRWTKTASRFDVLGLRLPQVHTCRHFAVMPVERQWLLRDKRVVSLTSAAGVVGDGLSYRMCETRCLSLRNRCGCA
jgi:hypothetical protein